LKLIKNDKLFQELKVKEINFEKDLLIVEIPNLNIMDDHIQISSLVLIYI